MKIVLTTGIYPPDVGGPATYVAALGYELRVLGHEVRVVTYRFEKKLPTGVRHLLYFFRVLPAIAWCDAAIAFDTFSVGFPAVLAAKLLRKKIVIRIGGDFLWEQYVERTHESVTLPVFNTKINPRRSNLPQLREIGSPRVLLTLKEKIIFYTTRLVVRCYDKVVFSTSWQRDIWHVPYGIRQEKTRIIENQYKVPAHHSDTERGQTPL